MEEKTLTKEMRRAELLEKLDQAGFGVACDEIFNDVVFNVVGRFDDDDCRAWIDRGTGSAGLIVNRLCGGGA